MEKKTNKALEQAMKIYGEDADILIIAHKDGQCGSVLHGNGENIAQAIFACMHQPNSPIAREMYRIIRLNVMNILNNPSPYAANLAETVVSMIPESDNVEEAEIIKEDNNNER